MSKTARATGTDNHAAQHLQAGVSLLQRQDVVRIARVLLGVLFVAALAAAATAIVFGDRKALIASSIGIVALPALWRLLERGQVSIALTGASSLLLGIALYVVLLGRGVHDVGMMLFPLVILVSGLLLDRRLAAIMSILSVAAAVSVGYAERWGYLRPHNGPVAAPEDILDVAILLAAVALLVRLTTDALYRGLGRVFHIERGYREIFDATNEAILVQDPESGAVVDVNEAAIRMSGWARDEIVGRTLGELLGEARRTPTSMAVRADVLADSLQHQVFDATWTRKDGGELSLEVVLKAATIGERRRVLAVARDVTERLVAQQRMREGEKLRAVGQLAGGVAHDFNNQLTGVLASASLLERELGDRPQARQPLDIIIRCARRSADLTKQLLAFARKGKQLHVPVDCEKLVDEVIALLQHSIDKRVRITKNGDGTGPTMTSGDPSLLQNCILNLGINAAEAMPNGGALTFELARERITGRRRPGLTSVLPEGPYVVVRVRDTGVGMAPETLARLFEPFFTTKPTGNGMGLAAVYGTVQSHAGAVAVESHPGEGTTFELLLPEWEQPTVAEREPEPIKNGATKVFAGVRVLLAEDEPAVAQVLVRLLSHLGCHVKACRDGAEALNAYNENPTGFDVILLDQGMPRMQGVEVLRQLRAAHARVPVLLSSGFTGDVQAPSLELADGFLPKPFTLSDLTVALSGVLGTRVSPPPSASVSPP